MTTEQKLREALARAESALADAGMDDECEAIQAALAIPATPVREEWRVTYDVKLFWWWYDAARIISTCEHEAQRQAGMLGGMKRVRNIRIQHRLVPEPVPWEDVE